MRNRSIAMIAVCIVASFAGGAGITQAHATHEAHADAKAKRFFQSNQKFFTDLSREHDAHPATLILTYDGDNDDPRVATNSNKFQLFYDHDNLYKIMQHTNGLHNVGGCKTIDGLKMCHRVHRLLHRYQKHALNLPQTEIDTLDITTNR